jgi:L-2-hydroxyglutarate oxidase LhgO|tara:strand:- start:2491 stop:3627 length:1137 start_codon:yes stop_codon:yes gene_type:complete
MGGFSMDEVHTCVIGAGVIGLAVGAKLAASDGSLFILEEQAAFGQDISSRNSEVIHAGIYYAKDSLKARLCVAGKHLLYRYCEERDISHRRIGKLIVATRKGEEAVLESILGKAIANGVADLEYWSQQKLNDEEPAIDGKLALYSPSTGIVSAHELMLSLLHDSESSGATFTGRTRVTGVDVEPDRFIVHTLIEEKDEYSFCCRVLVNAAGLGAQRIAHQMHGLDGCTIPSLHLCKGNYYAHNGKSPFSHLIYPVPDTSGAGLGIHATLDLAGQVRFGPDVEYVEEVDYRVSETREASYYEAIRRYYPGLRDGELSPAYAGIRPKLQPADGKVEDFVIQGAETHGIEGLVQLYGIESPGLTASLAIADEVGALLRDHF